MREKPFSTETPLLDELHRLWEVHARVRDDRGNQSDIFAEERGILEIVVNPVIGHAERHNSASTCNQLKRLVDSVLVVPHHLQHYIGPVTPSCNGSRGIGLVGADSLRGAHCERELPAVLERLHRDDVLGAHLGHEPRRHEAVLALPQDHHALAQHRAEPPSHPEDGAEPLCREHPRHALLDSVTVQLMAGVHLAKPTPHGEALEQHVMDLRAVPLLLAASMRLEVRGRQRHHGIAALELRAPRLKHNAHHLMSAEAITIPIARRRFRRHVPEVRQV
mmetsp:Transcript_148577/g.413949  ORF Transcript_148577/g.413949 Transcript_148577/m.413949 type:complete len:277 (+) Transcript_148577:128-958(+)